MTLTWWAFCSLFQTTTSNIIYLNNVFKMYVITTFRTVIHEKNFSLIFDFLVFLKPKRAVLLLVKYFSSVHWIVILDVMCYSKDKCTLLDDGIKIWLGMLVSLNGKRESSHPPEGSRKVSVKRGPGLRVKDAEVDGRTLQILPWEKTSGSLWRLETTHLVRFHFSNPCFCIYPTRGRFLFGSVLQAPVGCLER